MVHMADLQSKNQILDELISWPAHHLLESTDSSDPPNMPAVWPKTEAAITNGLREDSSMTIPLVLDELPSAIQAEQVQAYIEDGEDGSDVENKSDSFPQPLIPTTVQDPQSDDHTTTKTDTSSEQKTARDGVKLMVSDGVRAFGIAKSSSSPTFYDMYLDARVLWPFKNKIQEKLRKNQWRIHVNYMYRKLDEKEGKAGSTCWFNVPDGVLPMSNPADGLGPGHALHVRNKTGYSTCGMLVRSEDDLFILTTGHGFAVGDIAYQKVNNIWLRIGECVLSESKVDPINGSLIDAALIKVYPGTQIPSTIAAPGLPVGRHIINVWDGNILHLDKVCVIKSGARGFTKGKITDVCYHEHDKELRFWHPNGILSDIPATPGDSGSILMSESGTAIAMLYGCNVDESSRRFGLLRDILPSLSRWYSKPLKPALHKFHLDLATAYPNPAFRQQMSEHLRRPGTLSDATRETVRIVDTSILPGVNQLQNIDVTRRNHTLP